MQINHIKINSLPLSSPVILAPMAGISNLPYRRTMKAFGAGLVFTEMVSANGLIREGRKTRELLISHPEESPLGVQLFGDNPDVLAEAAAMVVDDADLLDINMGCPVKKVIRSGAGSALLQEPQRVRKILKAVRKAYPGPLTIKIRSGWDDSSLNFLNIGQIAQDEGVDAITLHPRTRSQGFSGQADWTKIAELKNAVNIPVFGSGDIFTAEDGYNMLQKTGCDAVMIGRGGYGNPWLIRQIIELISGRQIDHPSPGEKYQVALNHLLAHRELFGDKKTLLEMRKHLCWYARGLAGAGHYRATLQKTEKLEQTLELTEEFFHQSEAA